MNLQSAASGFLAFLLLIPALQGKTDWKVTYTSSHICASKGSTVNIVCTYEYPVKKSKSQSSSINLESLWFTKIDRNNQVEIGKETDYKGRVEYICGENQCTTSKCSGACTLRFKDLKPSDSAEYKFWITTAQTDWGYTGSPGVNITVTDLQVKVVVLDTDKPTWLDLECHSICDITTTYYEWFRNGENSGIAFTQGTGRYYRGQVKDDRVIINSEDSYACAVKGFERFPSPSVYAPRTPSVTVSPSGEVEEGSSVTLSCSSDANPAAKYTWFKAPEIPVKGSGQNYTITNITSELGGKYYCQAHNAIGHHNSTWSSVNVKERSSSSSSSSSSPPSPPSPSVITAATLGTVLVFLATVLFLIFLWLRRRRASRNARDQGGRPDTTEEGEPREQQYSFINFPRSETQEVPHQSAGSHVQSHPTEQVLYSAVQFQRSNAVAEDCDQTESGETSEMYSTVQKKNSV
ncbi:B-cell receptor CD22-like isoform X1 [Gadus chalcogrammus]|uniref:B-cell receptor CD22-like isoform X1 n=1 Tax=Gadus chalcogrammus TaxID=1042646 RepID=UPI0024C4D3DE|nr:B-cell receptor CD22-like isoform X1 [Gadus chalcogrammus]XP_056440156.1 B-cell receptor CD22-like isoform X1 [Gadus chalcogrammus]XP_056440157.1 B-cell receptor CD22-like isoform X1 [Gadus chalcogrammus]XP_056440158.1 B-cell receptor CD22-like isoform X1 [Gadus chalcogrammus]